MKKPATFYSGPHHRQPIKSLVRDPGQLSGRNSCTTTPMLLGDGVRFLAIHIEFFFLYLPCHDRCPNAAKTPQCQESCQQGQLQKLCLKLNMEEAARENRQQEDHFYKYVPVKSLVNKGRASHKSEAEITSLSIDFQIIKWAFCPVSSQVIINKYIIKHDY